MRSRNLFSLSNPSVACPPPSLFVFVVSAGPDVDMIDSSPPEAVIPKKRRAPARRSPTARAEHRPPFPKHYWLVFAVGLVPAALALAHTPGINGPYYWKWGYHDGPFGAYASLALAALGVAYWILTQPDSERGFRRGVIAATVLHLFLTFSYNGFAPDSFGNIAGRVEHPDINSYHSEAQRVDDVGHWLATFPERTPGFLLHAKTHPPAPILYYVFLNRVFGTHSGALVGGILLGLLGAVAIPLLYFLVCDLSGSARAGLLASTLWAILPGPILMLTSFDAVFPVATLALVLLWRRALSTSSLLKTSLAAGACGCLMFVALLFAHNILVLGAWFSLATGLTVFFETSGESHGNALVTAATGIGVASAVVVAGFACLFAVTGYNHIAALRAAIEIQDVLSEQLHRPYSYTIGWDLYDYFLAGGWVTFGLTLSFFGAWRSYASEIRGFAIAAIGTLLIVDLSGVLAAEAARVWLFLQPFTVTLAALELARRSRSLQVAACGVVLFALAAIRASMNFI